ncbi:MAG TPA: hypothetical protein VFM97_00250 [Gammaproteobacteria bacterium]|nr:hypothetical protein [Gammaproteobacteria bacterium]
MLFLKAPTPAQAEAGNYKKKHIRFRGLDISIENPKGSVRSGVDPDGHEWRQKMHCAYGYIRRTEGVDGDHVDVYIGPDEDAENVYIVHQRKAGDWKAYDEDKCMLGFATLADAKRAYLRQYDDPRFLGPVTVMPFEDFKDKALATFEKPAMIKSAVNRARLPQVGDRVEFDSDRQTEKGPSGGEIIAVDGDRVQVAHSDAQEWFDWPSLQGEWRGNCWLMKALVQENPMATILFLKSRGLSDTMRSKIGHVGGEKREKMPASVFLLGKERKYPVKVKRNGKYVYSPKLLTAAAKRARMEGRDDLAERAERIRQRIEKS